MISLSSKEGYHINMQNAEEIISRRTDLKTRFAPSPTGHLHLGHVASMGCVLQTAAKYDARAFLRIEDHDQQRCKQEFIDQIFEDICWLGWQEKFQPYHTTEPESYFLQSLRLSRYESILQVFKDKQLVYPCRCSRKDILSRLDSGASNAFYDGRCLSDPPDEKDFSKCHWRMNTQKLLPIKISYLELISGRNIPQTREVDDFIVKNNQGHFSYIFAVVIDDFDQKMNLIVRGSDLLQTTLQYLCLYELLQKNFGGGETPIFVHHDLIFSKNNIKLSKRDGALSLKSMRELGMSPKDVIIKASAAFPWGISINV